jgi:hypothetical protein
VPAYIPDPTIGTEPTDAEKASSMGAEFRALKTYIQDILIGTLLAAKAPLGGTGATGTWPISVTGTAALATSMESAGFVHTTEVVVRSTTPARGLVGLFPGDTTHAGSINFYDSTGANVGYVGAGDSSFHFLNSNNAKPWKSNVDVYAPNFIGNLNGAVAWTNVTGRPTNLSQFINDIGAGGGGGGGTIVSFQGRTATAAVLTSGDVTGVLGFTPYSNTNPAGYTTLAGVGSAGYQTTTGTVTNLAGAGNAACATVNATGLIKGNGGGAGLGAITVSSAAPSGGVDGDIWFQV